MKKCTSCGNRMYFSGEYLGKDPYCSDKCIQQGLVDLSRTCSSDTTVAATVKEAHEGPCPKCRGHGPNDVQKHYTVWSLIVLTSFKTVPEVCCRKCGIMKKLGGFSSSLLLGWWGIPFGILGTPVQLMRNLAALFSFPRSGRPSKELERLIRIELGSQAAMIREELELQQQAQAGAE